MVQDEELRRYLYALNLKSSHKDNKLGVLGVHEVPSGKYLTQFKGSRVGLFDSIEEVRSAYNEAKSRTNEVFVGGRSKEAFQAPLYD